MELLLNLCQNHFRFSSCLFAFTIRNIRLWMEILCAANCWTLKQMPPPPYVFCTLGCVVTSPLLLLFYSSLYKGSVLTLWKWGCKIRMTMCEMETSVYHFAIRTLQCSFLAAIKSLSYAFISWFAFIFIFSSTQSLRAFWKLAGQLSCLSLFSVSNTDVQGLRSVGLKRAFQWGSEVQVVLWNSVSSRLCSLPRSLPVHCGNKWTPESRPKCGTTWGSSHHLPPQHHIVTEAETAALPCP